MMTYSVINLCRQLVDDYKEIKMILIADSVKVINSAAKLNLKCMKQQLIDDISIGLRVNYLLVRTVGVHTFVAIMPM